VKRLQVGLILTLFLLPLLTLVVAGAWALWTEGLIFWLWWIIPVCWGLVFVLQKWWKLFIIPMPAMTIDPPLHWTPQDKAALAMVEARQKKVAEVPTEKLAEPRFYVDVAREISFEIAKHYHPKAANPWNSATMIEVLAAAQLALADVEEWASRYVPGSHVVSLGTWRTLERANQWMDTATNIYWAGAILLNPLNLGRMLASKLTIEPLTGHVQANVLSLFYVFFVRQVGFYAIELNSGRLRGGVAKYRNAMARFDRPLTDAGEPLAPVTASSPNAGPAAAGPGEARSEPFSVTLAVVGQAKAGKSSLVNALLGERKARSDVLPATQNATEYRLTLEGAADRLILVDTAGYGTDATGDKSWADSEAAVERADLVLLVLKATSPARSADLHFMTTMQAWYAARPRLKPPKIIAVLTHIDGLSPAMEWSPPYRWESPTSAKEEHIRDAVNYVIETFGDAVTAVVPVCGDVARNRVYGVEEWLVPAIWQMLGEARGTSFVRTLRSEVDTGRLKHVLHQVREAAAGLISATLRGKSAS
jgi:predicted GTPase